MNLEYYVGVERKGKEEGVSVGEVDAGAAALLRYIRFRGEDGMSRVCRWHSRSFR